MAGETPAPLALYRRYRPGSFAEVKGQDHVTEPLRQALRSGRVHHAYLFSGPRGCGKTSSARILARSLNCELGPTPEPCGTCESCLALAPTGPGSIDVIEIDAASHGGVDDARDLRERAFYAPVSGRYKIYIIDEAHMVTREGFNALLKLVEEPPPHLKFVFATTEPEKVIPTIRSRTHHYPFRLVPPAVLREHLEQILASEGVPFEPAVLPVVIRAGAGSVRDALSVLDQLIAGSDESGLRYERAIALLGYTDDRLLDEVIEAFAADDGAGVFRAIDHVVEAGHDPRRFAADLLDRLRDLIVLSAVPDAVAVGLIDAPPDRLEPLAKQAGAIGGAGLTRAAEIISAGLTEMRGATQPRLLLELMCAQVLLPAADSGTAGLADRLERLERRLSAGTSAQAESTATAPRREAVPRAAEPGPRQPDSEQRQPERPRSAPPAEPAVPAARPHAGRADAIAPDATAGDATAPGATAPNATGADAAALRSRWPDVLEAVQGRKRVAWMQLSNASVLSFEDGVLTLDFAQAGTARGFLTGGYDQVLGQVLADMFGVTPRITTSVGAGEAEVGPRPAARDTGRPAGPRPAAGNGVPGHGASAGTAADVGQAAGAGGVARSGSAADRARPTATTPGQAGRARRPDPPSRPVVDRSARPSAADEPEPDDQPDPDGLTGSGLIERELGGRLIGELDGP
ncbi:MAG TPA: DNA polymerase III subunit gamma and tau [Streptosporangiaceae bacterium]|nr:DNA polymerase III subunit gamma and tau [Streptosporangiaceae bacterium]